MRLLAAVLALIAPAVPAAGQVTNPEFGGYVRLLAAGQDLGYDAPGVASRSAFGGGVLRLQWVLWVNDRVHIDVHSRMQGSLRSEPAGSGVLGLGVSAAPRRTVQFLWRFVEGEHGFLEHDFDRLSVTGELGFGDLIVGRQAITWGLAAVFPVADLWTQFSPFELDTEQKPGTDAIRVLAYPTRTMELDLVVADRGDSRFTSAGARATFTLPMADAYVALGKFWRNIMAMGGFAAVADVWKLRVEAGLPWDLDRESLGGLRATVGVDRIGVRYSVTVEYHHNGLGSNAPADYAALLATPALRRGETYYLGRHLVGAFGSWMASDRWTASLGTLANPGDGSAALLPSVTWDAGQRYRFIAGGLWSFGSTPVVQPPAGFALRSEFGTYGRFAYVQAAVYF